MGEAALSPLRGPHLTQRALLGVLLLAAGLVLLFAAASFLWPNAPVTRTTLHDLPTAPYDVRAFEVDGIEGFLVRQEDGGIEAFWARSTHLGCGVEYRGLGDGWLPDGDYPGGAYFSGVCHGEIWDLQGDRVYGPQPRGLDRFPVTMLGDHVDVDLGTVLLGSCDPGIEWLVSTPRCSTPDHPRYERGPAVRLWPRYAPQ